MKRIGVRGRYIIKKPDEVIEDSYVIVEGSTISGITEDLPGDIEEVIGDPHDIVMPGLINTHTHAAMTLFRGIADDLPLMTWLKEHIFPMETRFVDKEFVYMGSLLAAWEMIRTGTTGFCDGYFFEDQVARAAKDACIRAWVGEGILDFPTPSIPDPDEAILKTREFIERWIDDPLVTPTVFPHAVYTCSPERLKRAYSLAEDYDLVFQIHLSETASEVDQVKSKYKMSPVALMDSVGCLSERTLAAHCVVLSKDDLDILSRRRATVAHNAESNMKLASGIAPVPSMLSSGINVTIGTDGCASNNNLDMIGEMSTVAKIHKVARLDATVMDAPTVLAMATQNAARAFNARLGSLEKGMLADIVVLDGRSPNMVPNYNPISNVVYAASGLNVKHVIIDGRIVLKDGICTTLDIESLMSSWNEIQERVRAYR
ncbi:MAG: amidohydrolase [Deltaproteobacteria bacterium]|nr:amidohydrolase [Deltaproteobacteria bacterium]